MRFRHIALALVLPVLLLSTPLTAQSTRRDAYLAASDSTESVAKRYMRAYVDLDWDTVEGLLGEDASFQDPTAALIFSGDLTSGRDNMMFKFRRNYSGIEMSFAESRAFFTGQHAVFEGTLTWSAPLQAGGRVTTNEMPFVVALKVEGGKVTEHRDFADYHTFIDAMTELGL